MKKTETQGFVRSRCMAKFYDFIDVNSVQKTNKVHNKHELEKSTKTNVSKDRASTTKLQLYNDEKIGRKGSKNAKNNTEQRYDEFEAITKSSIYLKLSRQYAEIKSRQDSLSKELKKEILALNDDIRKQEQKLASLNNLKHSLVNEVNELGEVYSNVKLRNYELECHLYAERGYAYGDNQYYDSEQEIQSQDMDYENLLQLEERLGKVSLGYDENTISSLKVKAYAKKNSEIEDKCCICCEQLESGEVVFTTECGHIHHCECLKKWLRVKRQCPLCRNQIILS